MAEWNDQRIDELKEYVDSRASKDAVRGMRKGLYWLIGLVVTLVMAMGGTTLSAYLLFSGTNGRVIAIERDISYISDRQKENNEILSEIERLLRAP